MCDKWLIVVLAGLGLVYNYVTPGQAEISPEMIYTSAFGYLTGSVVGAARARGGATDGVRPGHA